MAKLTIEQLNNTAEELDDLMALDPAPPKDGSKEEIETWIKEAAEELQPQDVISEETQSILEVLGVWIAPENREEFEGEAEELDLIKELDEAESLKDLKALVKSYDEFKSLRGTINKYKAGDEEDLKEEMFFLLEPEKEEKKPETKVVKMTPSGRKEVPIPKKKEKTSDKIVKKSVEKFTRIMAVAIVLKKNPKYSQEKVIQSADELYREHTGAVENLKETNTQYTRVIQVMKIFDLL